MQDRGLVQLGHGLGSGGCRKECGRDLVDLLVSALRAEQNGDQQREGVAVVERDWGLRVSLVQMLAHVIGPFLLLHPSTERAS